jgi:hypothetical protein
MEINKAEVVADVAAAFADYEDALVAGDAGRIVGWFWDSELVVRYGIADRQTGAAEHRLWRMTQPPLSGRRLADTSITTFGADFAVVTTLFGYAGSDVSGRQSQTWVRLPEGWRIVSAHVSAPAGADAFSDAQADAHAQAQAQADADADVHAQARADADADAGGVTATAGR